VSKPRFSVESGFCIRFAETGTKSGTKFGILLSVEHTAPRWKCLISRYLIDGAAQESNLPSDGSRRLTGFEALLRNVHSRTEAGFRPRFSPSRCGEVR
jgi:hypothetical protein